MLDMRGIYSGKWGIPQNAAKKYGDYFAMVRYIFTKQYKDRTVILMLNISSFQHLAQFFHVNLKIVLQIEYN